ncbi:alpha-ribazole transporter [Listeria seeligeri]|uniref:ECF transporter S component n=1 Tax=Listeria seeligeri TaxID=1640 RepID=UPI0018885D9B|nr:ECF transporter S component [Listeria seeligeri]MBF2630607.1 ECF transporter S component [Listeria seeligeri]
MKIQKLVLCAMLIVMCVIGANIKLMGSVAFDAAPAFIGTLLLGPMYGAILGIFGHLTSALLAGFPLTLPIHLIVAGMMGITMIAYGFTRQMLAEKTQLISVGFSSLVAFVFNCPLSLLALYPFMHEAVLALFPVLAIGTICNIFVAEIVYQVLPERWKKRIAGY